MQKFDTRWIKAKRAHAALQAFYPDLFNLDNPKPFKIGIRDDVRAAFPEMSEGLSKRLLGWLCSRRHYLRAVSRGGHRYGLDGAVAGNITAEEIAFALERFHYRNERALDRWPSIDTPFVDRHLERDAAE